MSWFTQCFGCSNEDAIEPMIIPQNFTRTDQRQPLGLIQPPDNQITQSSLIICTKLMKKQILYRETKPERNEQKLYRYNCPICFKFFTRIYHL